MFMFILYDMAMSKILQQIKIIGTKIYIGLLLVINQANKNNWEVDLIDWLKFNVFYSSKLVIEAALP